MVNQEEKAKLWKLIQDRHPRLAAALKARQRERAENVAIDGYPRATTQWIREAIRNHNSSLNSAVESLEEVKDAFDGAGVIEIQVGELIEVLAASSRQEVAETEAA